jgi:UDP-N-acetylglucosamine 2-epimerase (non-hydrolysing)
VLSDSGTLPEEASILGFPAVSIRTSTERQETFDKGVILIGGITTNEILQSVELCRQMWDNHETCSLVDDYADSNVSGKVIKLIQSFTSIVNRTIWRKS